VGCPLNWVWEVDGIILTGINHKSPHRRGQIRDDKTKFENCYGASNSDFVAIGCDGDAAAY